MAKKYEYKFIKIGLRFWSDKPKQDYQQIIKDQAQDGWRLCEILAPTGSWSHRTEFIELIFEREL